MHLGIYSIHLRMSRRLLQPHQEAGYLTANRDGNKDRTVGEPTVQKVSYVES